MSVVYIFSFIDVLEWKYNKYFLSQDRGIILSSKVNSHSTSKFSERLLPEEQDC